MKLDKYHQIIANTPDSVKQSVKDHLDSLDEQASRPQQEAGKEEGERLFTAADIETHYKEWLNETKRGGSVLLGKSVNEFFTYLQSLQNK